MKKPKTERWWCVYKGSSLLMAYKTKKKAQASPGGHPHPFPIEVREVEE